MGSVDLTSQLEDIRLATGISADLFPEYLGLSPEKYNSMITARSEVPAASLMRLCAELDLSMELILTGRLDLSALSSRYGGNIKLLPKRYEHPRQKLSKMRSVQTIYQAMVRSQGSNFARKILARMQVSPVQLTDPNDFVSLNLITDVLSELRKIDSDEQSIRRIGTHANEVNKSTGLGTALSNAKTGKEAYRAMHEELMHFFDLNWRYRLLKLSSNECEVEVTTRPETAEAFSQKSVGSREGCLCRQGIYQSILMHLPQGQLATIQERQCMYAGADRCIYVLSWN